MRGDGLFDHQRCAVIRPGCYRRGLRTTEPILKAQPITIGIISSVFVALQGVPCLMVWAFLLIRVA